NGVVQIRPGLRDALDRVPFGGRAEPQPVELRKDVPHPMRLLPAPPDLGECLFVVVLLRLHEAVQVVRVARAAGFVRACHKPTSFRRTLKFSSRAGRRTFNPWKAVLAAPSAATAGSARNVLPTGNNTPAACPYFFSRFFPDSLSYSAWAVFRYSASGGR